MCNSKNIGFIDDETTFIRFSISWCEIMMQLEDAGKKQLQSHFQAIRILEKN